MGRICVFLMLCLFGHHAGFCADRFVAPDGKVNNAGSESSPWDITTALGGKQKIRPGDTVWMMKGAYKHPWKKGETGRGFEVKLAGNKTAPITVRSCPGHRVTIDGLQVVAPSRYLWRSPVRSR